LAKADDVILGAIVGGIDGETVHVEPRRAAQDVGTVGVARAGPLEIKTWSLQRLLDCRTGFADRLRIGVEAPLFKVFCQASVTASPSVSS
jgi:hypothetical protein